jgi:uncharacterized protein
VSDKRNESDSGNKYFEIRSSPIQGRGAFAIRKIRKGTRIIEYTGEMISTEESDRRYVESEKKRHHTFLFIVDPKRVVDGGVNGNASRFINHSCDPNCETFIEKRHIYIDALRTIQPGEELNYDYQYDRDGESDAQARKKYPCHCGAESCRGTIMVAAKKPRKRVAKERVAKKRAGKKRPELKTRSAAKRKRTAARKERSGPGKRADTGNRAR